VTKKLAHAMSEAIARPAMKQFRWPIIIIFRFVTRRTVRSAAFLAIVFGAYVASKAAGYATAYPTLVERTKLAVTFGNNIGISAIVGAPHHLDTVVGFTAWNTLGVMVIVGAIWAFLLATRTFRGEEEAGRTELLLAGQTTARGAAINTLVGLRASLAVLYGVTAITFIGVGKIHTVNFGIRAALFFALAAVASPAIFIAVGALASQLMPTRARAASFSAGVFGVFFLIRALADSTSAHWLLNITPLGWVERLQPLYGSQPLWLIPIVALIALLSILTVWLAGRRDLGASSFADKDSAKPRTTLLKTPFSLALRLRRTANLSWLAAIGVMMFFFGLLTKSAAVAVSQSASAQKVVHRLAHQSQLAGSTAFLGITFFLLMTLTMAYTASAISAMREDEAEGYLDNLLVRPVSRWRWLLGRLTQIIAMIIVAGAFASLLIWIGEASQHNGVSFHSIVLAGVNALAPAIFTLGAGIAAFGLWPRLTSLVAYSVIAWSFLIAMVSSGINLNHWLLDTSVLHHISFAPAVSPVWETDLIMAAVGLLLAVIGGLNFNRRDLEGE
jgi:ABC-2 type transport system permease protein